MKTSLISSLVDNELFAFNSVKVKKGKIIPFHILKELLFYFDVDFNDVPKLLNYAELLKKQKQFRRKHQRKFNSLTEKEKEVFLLVADGFTSKEIAEKLFVEPCTVSTHRKHIKCKLRLKSHRDWFAFAAVFKNT